MATTAQHLRRLREAGLSQMEIARRSSIPQSKLSRWEAGRIPASADEALRLAELAAQIVPQSTGEPIHA